MKPIKYRVRVELDVWAKDAHEAAHNAMIMLRNPYEDLGKFKVGELVLTWMPMNYVEVDLKRG